MARQTESITTDDMQSELHREFLLSRLRMASLRLKTMEAEVTTIGIALKGGMIGSETAVTWLHNENLMWLVWPLPEEVGRMVGSDKSIAANSANSAGDEPCEP